MRRQGSLTTIDFRNIQDLISASRYLAGRVKKSLFYGLLMIGAVFVAIGAPSGGVASALSMPSFISGTLSGTVSAPAPSNVNSQTMPLLAPAVNLDPNPAKGGGDITVVDNSALQPQAGPSGTAADIEEWPTSSQVSVYTVHDGDTLGSIAKLFNVSMNTVVWANNIKNGVVHPGDTLVILPITGIKHTIVKGETLASIAKKFKADAGEIAQFNGLDPNSPLTVGDSILIPNGEMTVAAPAASNSHSSIIKGIAKGTATEPYLGGSGPVIAGYYAWPVAGGRITQGLHGWNAVDIGAPKGTHIYAAADGIVIVARDNGAWNGGYGNYVVIQHSNGTQTLYAHMTKTLVSAGDSVSQGETIGLVGATGEATGPHLHFEVRGAANPFADLPLGSSD